MREEGEKGKRWQWEGGKVGRRRTADRSIDRMTFDPNTDMGPTSV